MVLFKDMLREGESLFKDTIALDFDYIPKILPFREKEQKYVAECIGPLLKERNGRNLFIYGPPGIGKTAAVRWVLRDLENETDQVTPIYVNCWQKNTSFKILVDICDQIGYKFTQNKKTNQIFQILRDKFNKTSAVFVFDEVDKAEELDFLYMILEEIYRKSVILITNFREFALNLDERLKSRLVAETLEFEQYNEKETFGILKERSKYAFVSGVWEDNAFDLIAKKTAEIKDLRTGLYLLREAGTLAEDQSSRKITIEHAKKAIEKLDQFSIKDPSELGEDTQMILKIIKENPNSKIGDLYEKYKEKGAKTTYKTFQRKIEVLEKNNFISVEKTMGGKEGNTSIINIKEVGKVKTLGDY